MKKIIVIVALIGVGFITSWYFDLWHKPVEKIDDLIGLSFDDANKIYFKSKPDNHYELNINNDLNEFDGGILNQKEILKDSIIHVYTWEFETHNKTIWVGDTKKMKSQIIDAIRYNNKVLFKKN